MPAPHVDIEAVFWSRVDKGPGCWEWNHALNANGYGYFWVKKGESRLAHRYGWRISVGPIPDGLCVLHHCDNPKCVRPDHLFLGTIKDNTQDMLAKGRGRITHHIGEAHGRAKVTEQDVVEIRRLRRGGLTEIKVAAQFGISRSMVGYITREENWRHVA